MREKICFNFHEKLALLNVKPEIFPFNKKNNLLLYIMISLNFTQVLAFILNYNFFPM